jgi:hypothetical protein
MINNNIHCAAARRCAVLLSSVVQVVHDTNGATNVSDLTLIDVNTPQVTAASPSQRISVQCLHRDRLIRPRRVLHAAASLCDHTHELHACSAGWRCSACELMG